MTRILALDTSTDACSVALQCGEHTLFRFELAARSHTQRLLPMVDEVLSEAGMSLSDLDALAFGRGPGSFTGLRICLGVVQGLAFSHDLPVIGVSTLDAMALAYYREHPELSNQALLVALDARMQEVYWSLYRWEGESQRLIHLVNEAVAKPQHVAEQPLVQGDSSLFGVGPGWHYPAFEALNTSGVDMAVHPNAQFMLPLALESWAKGLALPAEQAQPVYLRDEISWKKRERIRS